MIHFSVAGDPILNQVWFRSKQTIPKLRGTCGCRQHILLHLENMARNWCHGCPEIIPTSDAGDGRGCRIENDFGWLWCFGRHQTAWSLLITFKLDQTWWFKWQRLQKRSMTCGSDPSADSRCAWKASRSRGAMADSRVAMVRWVHNTERASWWLSDGQLLTND